MARWMPARVALACALMTAAVSAHAGDAKPFRLQDVAGSERFDVSGSFRVRYESFDNDFRPTGPDAADLLTLRTSIKAEYHDGGIKLGGELRDVRAYLGDAATPYGANDANALELIQLYAGAKLGPVAVTGGRFLLDLGSTRFSGDPGFRNAGNGFTGLRLDWTGKRKQVVTLFYTYPQQRLPSDKQGVLDNRVVWDHEGNDLVFWGGFASTPGLIHGLTTELYLYGLDENDRPGVATRNRHLVMPGLRLLSKAAKGKFDGQVEAAYQFGNILSSAALTATRLDVSAYTVHAELGYTVPGPWQPHVLANFDIASGDHAGSKSYNRFDFLFGPRRFDWGPSGIYGPLSRNNIVSAGVRLDLKPGKRTDFFIWWRDNWLESATDSFAKTGIVDPSGQSGTHAGSQIEARLRYWLVPKQIQLDAGAAIFAKGRFLGDAPNAPARGDTRYFYTDINFQF